jgi:hypothetical protein
MHSRLFSLLLPALVLFLPLFALGSGSYTSRPPRPPASTPSIDSDKYNLGKQIYSGKATLGAANADVAAQQSPRLKELQDKLPRSAQRTANLPDLAGKLSTAQMQALEYYLEVRYKIK